MTAEPVAGTPACVPLGWHFPDGRGGCCYCLSPTAEVVVCQRDTPQMTAAQSGLSGTMRVALKWRSRLPLDWRVKREPATSEVRIGDNRVDNVIGQAEAADKHPARCGR